MSEKKNWALEIKKLEVQRQQIIYNKMNLECRIMALMDEKQRLEENFPTYDKELIDIQQKIANLQKFVDTKE